MGWCELRDGMQMPLDFSDLMGIAQESEETDPTKNSFPWLISSGLLHWLWLLLVMTGGRYQQ